ncbi:hypothetical protein ACXZ1K_14030 [Pedobacter sp. PWIIR3]
MKTPPKDNPVRKDENLTAEKDEFQTDEAIAAKDTEIQPKNAVSPSDVPADDAIDEVKDNSETGLNTEDKDEIF